MGDRGFKCRVELDQDFSRDRLVHLAVNVGFPRVVCSGAYLLSFQSLRANPRDEIRNILSLTGVPYSWVSDEGLINSVVNGVLTATAGEEEEGDGLMDIIPLSIDIKCMEEKEIEEEETVENCTSCREDIVDENGQDLECGHVFHLDCLLNRLIEEGTCPACGYEVEVN